MAKKAAKKTAKRQAKVKSKKTKAKNRVKKPSKKKPAQKKSGQAWYGIVIDGKRVPFSLPSVTDARATAAGLKDQGYKVAIYDMETGRIVKR
jgi:hypothetical protein